MVKDGFGRRTAKICVPQPLIQRVIVNCKDHGLMADSYAVKNLLS